MKSLTAVCQTGASMPAISPAAPGRISRHPHQRGDGENAEMKMYLSKLKDLVPFMPKNRKLSKLEIIQHVIDYICDLQSELETHPEIGNFDAASALNFAAAAQQQSQEDGDDADIADDDDEDMLSERLAAESNPEQQEHMHASSPAAPARQPLVDRPAPNTILPVTSASTASSMAVIPAALLQQQQQQPHQSVATANSAQTPTTAEKDSRQPC